MAWEMVPGRAHSPHRPSAQAQESRLPSQLPWGWTNSDPLFPKEGANALNEVVSSWRIRLNVSRILLNWDRRAALYAERASSLNSLFLCLRALAQDSWFDLVSLAEFQGHSSPSVFDAPGPSKKISNNQELIQSDPISCPQNQKGNN